MNNKNVKVVDEHNIDRNANVMFAFDLEGSEYVVYWIERDEDNGNIFVSKVIKNLDGTFNMLDIDDSMEKSKLVDIVKTLITTAVNSNEDKLVDSSVTLADNRVIKFITVLFNKEQRINVQKTYITTVKKEVTRVTEKYYSVEVKTEDSKIFEDIFPNVDSTSKPFVEPMKENNSELNIFNSSVNDFGGNLSVKTSAPISENSDDVKSDGFVTFGTETTIPKPSVETPIISTVKSNTVPFSGDFEKSAESITSPAPTVVESITTGESAPSVVNSVTNDILSTSNQISAMPSASDASVVVGATNVSSSSLVFNAANETNLNAALGEVASSTSIPVGNIEPIREFGVDDVIKPSVENSTEEVKNVQVDNSSVSPKSGFANSKFFMVVAVAFFLASCVFLGYEVFNYFQLTK